MSTQGSLSHNEVTVKIKPRTELDEALNLPEDKVTVSTDKCEVKIEIVGDTVHVEIGTAKESRTFLIDADSIIY